MKVRMFVLHKGIQILKNPYFLVLLIFLFSHSLEARTGDLGNGFYRNPVLYSDYSDPDVIRVGKTYYMVSSSFEYMPGIPILESHDLVNWQIIGHVYPRLTFNPQYNMIDGNRYGQGAWAPSIRYHNGRLYVFFATPREGIFMSSASSAKGPWTKPKAVISGPGYEDPCPFWDSDGRAWIIHSRVGAGPLILNRMSPDGTRVLDSGREIVNDPVHLPTLEGPKLYKRGKYYYIFAPYGGVGHGSQAVLRATNLYGPWQFRTVLEQGDTDVNGPHQGGWVETPEGQSWFLHFSMHGGYGRILYLEPMRWRKGWPIIGKPIPGTIAGQPVTEWRKPDVGKTYPIEVPQTSDEFNSSTLGLQWEWNHNPSNSHWSSTVRPGYLRLRAMYAPDLLRARNTLTQQMEYAAFEFTTSMDVSSMQNGEQAGLAMFGFRPSWIGVVQSMGKRNIVFVSSEGTRIIAPLHVTHIELRMHVARQTVSYSYSVNGGQSFVPVGTPQLFHFSWWKAARPALFTFNTLAHAHAKGWVDFNWVHCAPMPNSLVVGSASHRNQEATQ